MRSLPPAGLYGILDTRWLALEALPLAAYAYLEGGCRVLQLRMKDSSDQDRLAAQRAVSSVASDWDEPVWIAINDRADLARVLGHEAPANVRPILHLGQEDVPPEVARRLVGQDMVIGLSTHNDDQVARASLEDVDYLGYGPVYPTLTKSNPDPTTGEDGLSRAIATAAKPVVAIGGVSRQQAPSLRKKGARWVVVVSDLLKDAELGDAAGSRVLAERVKHLQGSLA